jgi:hypothetical protein
MAAAETSAHDIETSGRPVQDARAVLAVLIFQPAGRDQDLLAKVCLALASFTGLIIPRLLGFGTDIGSQVRLSMGEHAVGFKNTR